MTDNLIRPQNSQAVPTSRFDRAAQEHKRIKVRVLLSQKTEQTLSVTLSLPLNPEYAAEANFLEHFGLGKGIDVYYDIQYSVEMNFETRRQKLDEQIRKIYGNEENEILGKEELEVIDHRQLTQLLAPLATLGANTFFKLFMNTGNTLLSPNETHGQIVRDAISSVFSRPRSISIKTDFPAGQKSAPLFPWAFLYDDRAFQASNRGTLNPQRFWGFKHIIQEELLCTNTVIDLPAIPSILTAICSDTDKPQWHKSPQHPLVKHNGNITEAPTVAELGTALKTSTHDCFYFFGHAYQPDPPLGTESRLELCGEYLTVDDLNRIYDAPQFSQNPVLAFLNGCRTAPLNVWDNESIAGFLCETAHQKVCCVSTVASVPGSVAAMFGCHFWKLFLKRKLPVGDALLKTRRVILRKWNNPLGLLYTIFGRVDTHVQREVS